MSEEKGKMKKPGRSVLEWAKADTSSKKTKEYTLFPQAHLMYSF